MKRIEELQHEFLCELLLSQKPQIAVAVQTDRINTLVSTVADGIRHMATFNMTAARLVISQ